MSVALLIGLGASLAAVAYLAAMLGIGGGVLYTPIQIFFGQGIHEAAATSLFLIIILSISATLVYRRAGKVDWGMALLLETFTMAGGFCGGYMSDFMAPGVLTGILVAVIVFSGASMLWYRNRRDRSIDRQTWYLWHRQACGEKYQLNLALALPISFLAGMLSGMVGIGGGVLKVPMMVLLFGVPIDIAIATSGFMVGITAIGGFSGHLLAGHWDWRIGLILAPGVFLGAQLGAHTMLRVDKLKLKRAFGFLMFLVAAGLIVKMIVG